ncbi:MAG: hypothetical protein IPM38_00185 [Ignavibacteria bacterium]|nr:hypothetical protein [Ignavibacteria bacterium]
MKRREMIFRALQTGALLTLANPVQLFADKNSKGIFPKGTGNLLEIPPVF